MTAILEVNAWHPKFVISARMKSFQAIQPKEFAVQRKLNIPGKTVSSLQFKTSESEADEVEADEEQQVGFGEALLKGER